MTLCLAILALLAPWRFNLAFGSKRDWVGSGECGKCHPQHLAAWQATPHAKTRERFVGKPETRCLGCHGTGEAPAGVAFEVAVGCEACHGAGASYSAEDIMRNRKVAFAVGLADLTTPKARTALCMQCHARATRSQPFDSAAPVHAVKRPQEK